MRVSNLSKHPNGPKDGVVGNVTTVVVGGATSFALGYAMSSSDQHAKIFGVPTDLLTGVAAKTASLGLTLFGVDGKAGAARPHLDAIGNAALNCWMHTLGTGAGFKKSGRVRAWLPASSADKLRKLVPESTIFGVAARAPQGDLLSSSDLASLARSR